MNYINDARCRIAFIVFFLEKNIGRLIELEKKRCILLWSGELQSSFVIIYNNVESHSVHSQCIRSLQCLLPIAQPGDSVMIFHALFNSAGAGKRPRAV